MSTWKEPRDSTATLVAYVYWQELLYLGRIEHRHKSIASQLGRKDLRDSVWCVSLKR